MSKIKRNNWLNRVHSQLKTTNQALHAAMSVQTPKSGLDSNGDMKVNTLAVNIEFHLSKQSKHGKSIISLPINIPGYRYFSVADTFHGGEKEHSADSLEARHVMGRDQQIHNNESQIKGPKSYSGTTNYDTLFHHSEQALYEYLIQRSNLDDIVMRLKNHGLQNGTTITAVTIHIHSIRYVCGNCEIGGLGLMNQNYGFTNTLSQALIYRGLQFAQGVRFNIQVSADKPYGVRSPMEASTHKYGDLSKLTGVIAESDTKVATLPPNTTDLHSRTIMLSTDSRTLTKKCLSVFDAMRQQEYAEMIKQGHAVREHVRTSGNDMRFADAFTALALIPDSDSTSSEEDNTVQKMVIDKAGKVVNARAQFDEEIAQERLALEEIKHQLLREGEEAEGVRNLSANLLRAINKLILDGYSYWSILDALHQDYSGDQTEVGDIYEAIATNINILGAMAQAECGVIWRG